MEKTCSQQLAEFVCDLSLAAVPERTIHAASLSALDAIGVTLAAHRGKAALAAADLVLSWGGRPESLIFGHRERVPAHAAAFANAVAQHSIELDDHIAHTRSYNHPGVVSIPASYAVAEREDATGERFLTAVIAAYEINSRLNAAVPIGTFNFQHGFHGTALTGPFGSAAAAAVLSGATPAELTNAFGICGSMAAGSYEFKASGSWSKRFHAGWASQAGIQALDLARRGFKGPATILEGSAGFYAIYARDTTPNYEVLTQGLGEHFEFDYIMYKPFSCAGVLHAPLTALRNIMDESDFDHRDIIRIVVTTNRTVFQQMAEPRQHKIAPRTTVDAQFSVQYVVAAMCRFGHVLPSEFTDASIRDADVLRIAEGVTCEVDESFEKRFPTEELANVVIKFADGTELRGSTTHAKGSLGAPMTEPELKAKFRALTAGVLSEGQATKVIQSIDECPNIKSMRQITDQIRATAED